MVDLQVPSILTSGVGAKGTVVHTHPGAPASFPSELPPSQQVLSFPQMGSARRRRGAAIGAVPQALQAQQTKNRSPPPIGYCFWLS